MNQLIRLLKNQKNVFVTNKEWPMFAVMPLSDQQRVEAVPPKKINTKNLTTKDDLATLKKTDPFMYYSIPVVREATYLIEEVDHSNLDKSSIRRNCISYPLRMPHQSQCQDKRAFRLNATAT